MAAAMMRLRPSTSATAPMNGATSAIASVVAVTVRPTCAGPTANSCASNGNTACGAYRLRNVETPANAMAACRRSGRIDNPLGSGFGGRQHAREGSVLTNDVADGPGGGGAASAILVTKRLT
jgi:hypothetical protein